MQGKVALVTGGTSGIGRATSVAMAREGAKIVVTGLASEAEGGAVTVDTVKQEGGEAFFLPHDVREEDDWRRVVAATLERFGRLDVLDNNAGVAVMLPIEQLTPDHWYYQTRINIEGCFLGLKHAAPAMKKGGGGSVINMSSAAGLFGSNNGTSSYSATKGGIAGLTKAAALEFRPDNVRVNSVHPGFIRRIGPTAAGQESSASFRDRMKTRVPLGKIGEPVDIANMIVYLASDESRFVTGAEFVVDGGYLAA